MTSIGTAGDGSMVQVPGTAAAESGQALVLLVGALMAVLAGAVVLGWIAAGLAAASDRQRAADLAALAGARALLDARSRLLGADTGRARGAGLTRVAYIALARRRARETARRNGAEHVEIRFANERVPGQVTVTVRDPIRAPGGARIGGSAVARAEVAAWAAVTGDGEYAGPLARRQGRPMRPDVAPAFDRLEAAARAAGHAIVIASAYRSGAEQARLFAANPDPRWVAPPGRSLHRLGTELDLGPRSAYAWLARNAGRFGFVLRYPWEPWHFGFSRSPASASAGFSQTTSAGGALPAWVPDGYAEPIRDAARRHGVGAALLAAQLQQESGFDPRAVSRAGARGIAQFMPATARAYGLRDPFDASAAITAQARHMRDLLRRFGSVPLALAAYNAGAGRVAACWCVPPFHETQAYVRRIVALARGDLGPDGVDGGPVVRLVR